ncbi:protein NRT1/ PTR FAMILY 5.4-like [Quercus suber]|uniref:protein NRT1/ PTR FAMILY 5.4-like n=1 Tax=Quercus suber TaxID=58331 RepID=UPI0032DFE029
MSNFSYQPSSMDSSVAPVMIEDGQKETRLVSTKQKSSRGGWNAAIFVIFVEMAERFAYYGLAGNLITYLTNELHEPLATAAKNVNTWIGVSTLFPILGAFIADSYLGRFNTIIISSVIFLLGTVLLTLSVSVFPLHLRKAMSFLALYILSVGEGGHKPCVQTFAADQFDEVTPEEKKAKSSFFNWWYLGIVAAATSASLVVIYVQDNIGWTEGFGIPIGVIAVALTIFLLGIKKYRKEDPVGSPFTGVAQVFVAAARKWRMDETHHGRGVYYGVPSEGQPNTWIFARTDQFRFLDKAMIIDNIDISSKTRNPWRLCSLNQVEEVKLVLRLIPIWFSCIMFTVVQAQLHTFYIKQGSTMIRSIGHFHIPPGSLQALVGITILFAVPFYDRVFVPIARKFTGHPSGITVLQRIGVGLFLSILNMVVSALVEAKRVSIAKEYNLMDNPKATIPMTVWWLLPQYVICGFSDAFAVVGLQELFYDQMPEALRSMGAAAYISVVGVGSFIGNAIISVVQAISSRSGDKWLGNNLNRAHLDYYYWVLAGLSALSLCVYVCIAMRFVYKKVEEVEKTNGGRWVIMSTTNGEF